MIVDILVAIVGYTVLLISVGLVASFSPTLYVTQVGILSRSNHPKRHGLTLLAGVLAGITVAALLFEFIQPDTIRTFLSDAFNTIVTNQDFYLGFGLLFGGAALWCLLRRKPADKPKKKSTNKKAATASGIFSFAFAKILVSITALTATFLAIRILNTIELPTAIRLLIFPVFLTGVSVPYLGALWARLGHRKDLFKHLQKFSERISEYNYRLILGIVFAVASGLFLLAALISQY